MTNFIYIFMIVTLIGIGVCIKAFNSEDSDTNNYLFDVYNWSDRYLSICKSRNKS